MHVNDDIDGDVDVYVGVNMSTCAEVGGDVAVDKNGGGHGDIDIYVHMHMDVA